MGSLARRFNIVPLAAAAVIALAGCAISVDQRGKLPDPDRIAEGPPGKTSKDQVIKILGSPSSSSTFDDNTWYYISRKTKQVAFFQPEVLDQQVFVVDFDVKGVVKDLNHKTLADGVAITPAPGATPAPGRELSFLEQLIGNVGRFSGASK